jgi:hypothetical protein
MHAEDIPDMTPAATAHVADAIEEITSKFDYDSAGELAASLIDESTESGRKLKYAALCYSAGALEWSHLVNAVRARLTELGHL